jgi:hypothetical protein
VSPLGLQRVLGLGECAARAWLDVKLDKLGREVKLFAAERGIPIPTSVHRVELLDTGFRSR